VADNYRSPKCIQIIRKGKIRNEDLKEREREMMKELTSSSVFLAVDGAGAITALLGRLWLDVWFERGSGISVTVTTLRGGHCFQDKKSVCCILCYVAHWSKEKETNNIHAVCCIAPLALDLLNHINSASTLVFLTCYFLIRSCVSGIKISNRNLRLGLIMVHF